MRYGSGQPDLMEGVPVCNRWLELVFKVTSTPNHSESNITFLLATCVMLASHSSLSSLWASWTVACLYTQPTSFSCSVFLNQAATVIQPAGRLEDSNEDMPLPSFALAVSLISSISSGSVQVEFVIPLAFQVIYIFKSFTWQFLGRNPLCLL